MSKISKCYIFTHTHHTHTHTSSLSLSLSPYQFLHEHPQSGYVRFALGIRVLKRLSEEYLDRGGEEEMLMEFINDIDGERERPLVRTSNMLTPPLTAASREPFSFMVRGFVLWVESLRIRCMTVFSCSTLSITISIPFCTGFSVVWGQTQANLQVTFSPYFGPHWNKNQHSFSLSTIPCYVCACVLLR